MTTPTAPDGALQAAGTSLEAFVETSGQADVANSGQPAQFGTTAQYGVRLSDMGPCGCHLAVAASTGDEHVLWMESSDHHGTSK